MKKNLLHIETALLTSRTVVRRFRENDGESFFALLQDNHPRLQDYFPKMIERIKGAEDAEFFIRKKLALWLLQKEFMFGIWDNKSAKLVGFLHLFDFDWDLPSCQVSYFIDRDFTEKGLMTECLWRLVQFAFNQLKMEKLYIKTASDNYPSQRLARKCGFRREGDLRDAIRKQAGELGDLMLMALTVTEYKEL